MQATYSADYAAGFHDRDRSDKPQPAAQAPSVSASSGEQGPFHQRSGYLDFIGVLAERDGTGYGSR